VDLAIYQRLRKSWTAVRLEFAPMFRAIEVDNEDMVEEYETMWQLVYLAVVPH
jgi:hypothetical protein